MFQQIKDWKPDEDEEDPDMDILKQCQKWHEEDKHQKIVDALEAISAEERTPEMDMELARKRPLPSWNPMRNTSRETTTGTSVWAIPITI